MDRQNEWPRKTRRGRTRKYKNTTEEDQIIEVKKSKDGIPLLLRPSSALLPARPLGAPFKPICMPSIKKKATVFSFKKEAVETDANTPESNKREILPTTQKLLQEVRSLTLNWNHEETSQQLPQPTEILVNTDNVSSSSYLSLTSESSVAVPNSFVGCTNTSSNISTTLVQPNFSEQAAIDVRNSESMVIKREPRSRSSSTETVFADVSEEVGMHVRYSDSVVIKREPRSRSSSTETVFADVSEEAGMHVRNSDLMVIKREPRSRSSSTETVLADEIQKTPLDENQSVKYDQCLGSYETVSSVSSNKRPVVETSDITKKIKIEPQCVLFGEGDAAREKDICSETRELDLINHPTSNNIVSLNAGSQVDCETESLEKKQPNTRILEKTSDERIDLRLSTRINFPETSIAQNAQHFPESPPCTPNVLIPKHEAPVAQVATSNKPFKTGLMSSYESLSSVSSNKRPAVETSDITKKIKIGPQCVLFGEGDAARETNICSETHELDLINHSTSNNIISLNAGSQVDCETESVEKRQPNTHIFGKTSDERIDPRLSTRINFPETSIAQNAEHFLGSPPCTPNVPIPKHEAPVTLVTTSKKTFKTSLIKFINLHSAITRGDVEESLYYMFHKYPSTKRFSLFSSDIIFHSQLNRPSVEPVQAPPMNSGVSPKKKDITTDELKKIIEHSSPFQSLNSSRLNSETDSEGNAVSGTKIATEVSALCSTFSLLSQSIVINNQSVQTSDQTFTPKSHIKTEPLDDDVPPHTSYPSDSHRVLTSNKRSQDETATEMPVITKKSKTEPLTPDHSVLSTGYSSATEIQLSTHINEYD